MAKRRILIIEDEEDIQELVSIHLKKDGYEVFKAPTGEDGLRLARITTPDLLVLDRMLPGIDGLEVCRQMKQDPSTRQMPILMLTAKGEESDIITGLEIGADEYVTKPFSPKVLVARIRALIRRQQPLTNHDDLSAFHIRNLTIDPGRFQVRVEGAPVELTLSEFRILVLLARRPGWVFSRYQIVDAVRGEDAAVTERSVDVHIVGLRRKLGYAGLFIETVRGLGYRFKDA